MIPSSACSCVLCRWLIANKIKDISLGTGFNLLINFRGSRAQPTNELAITFKSSVLDLIRIGRIQVNLYDILKTHHDEPGVAEIWELSKTSALQNIAEQIHQAIKNWDGRITEEEKKCSVVLPRTLSGYQTLDLDEIFSQVYFFIGREHGCMFCSETEYINLPAYHLAAMGSPLDIPQLTRPGVVYQGRVCCWRCIAQVCRVCGTGDHKFEDIEDSEESVSLVVNNATRTRSARVICKICGPITPIHTITPPVRRRRIIRLLDLLGD